MEFRRSEVLAKALARMRENLGLVGQASSPEWKRAARDAAIQSFEFTYELAIKVIEASMPILVMATGDSGRSRPVIPVISASAARS